MNKENNDEGNNLVNDGLKVDMRRRVKGKER
jgi:hypothetical protein